MFFNSNYFECNCLETKLIKKEELDNTIKNFIYSSNLIYENVDNITVLTEAILINVLKPKYKILNQNKFFSTFKTLYDYGYEEGIVMISLSKNDINKSITFYSNGRDLIFNKINYHKELVICLFNL